MGWLSTSYFFIYLIYDKALIFFNFGGRFWVDKYVGVQKWKKEVRILKTHCSSEHFRVWKINKTGTKEKENNWIYLFCDIKKNNWNHTHSSAHLNRLPGHQVIFFKGNIPRIYLKQFSWICRYRGKEKHGKRNEILYLQRQNIPWYRREC